MGELYKLAIDKEIKSIQNYIQEYFYSNIY